MYIYIFIYLFIYLFIYIFIDLFICIYMYKDEYWLKPYSLMKLLVKRLCMLLQASCDSGMRFRKYVDMPTTHLSACLCGKDMEDSFWTFRTRERASSSQGTSRAWKSSGAVLRALPALF